MTPEIAARLRRGEHVSPEEIDAAVRAAEAKSKSSVEPQTTEDDATPEPASPPRRVTRSALKKKAVAPSKHVEEPQSADSDVNEWIPETHLKKPSQGRRKQR